MAYRNTGRYYWTTDFTPKNKDHDCGEAKIENVIFEDHMIEFQIINPGKTDHLNKINIIWDDLKGKFCNRLGNITCELFTNETKKMVYGDWNEDGSTYKWWAVTD